MSKQLINIRNKNQNKTEIGFGSNGLTVETGAVDPTVEIVVAKKGSLYLCSANGKTYQKQSDEIDLNWIEILNSTSGTPVDSVNGQTGDVVLDKSDVGLSNVDNTSDVNKPISSATQAALSAKENTGVAASLVSSHEAAVDPHSQYATDLDLSSGLSGKEDVGVAASLVSAHESALDPHSQYATDLDLSNGLSTKENTGVAAGLVSAHESALDPHSQYATDIDLSNGLATKENTGVAAGLVSSHESALDPHSQYQKESEKGAANGYASLDGAGKVPASQLPSSVMTYEGVWDANTNSPVLADGVGDAGMVYRVNVAGTQDLGSGSQTFNIGDYVVYNGSIWQQSDTTDAVASVNGQTGVVALDADDVLPSQTGNNDKILTTNGTTASWTNSVANLQLTGNPILNNIFMASYSNAGAGNALAFYSSQGTFASPTASTNGELFLFIGGRGHDGTSYNAGSKAAIQINASENHTPTANGTHMTFATTENGTTTRKNRVRVENTGALTIFGNTSGSISFKPAAVTTTHTLNLPANNASGALTNDGSGNLSWTAAAGGGVDPNYVSASPASILTTSNTLHDTFQDVTGASITINPSTSNQKWEIYAHASVAITNDNAAPPTNRYAYLRIADSGNNLVDDAEIVSARTGSDGLAGTVDVYPMSLVGRVTLSASETYKLQIKTWNGGGSTAISRTQIFGGPSYKVKFFAKRVY